LYSQTNAVLERLKQFLPQFKAANENVSSDANIESIDDEEQHIEMVVFFITRIDLESGPGCIGRENGDVKRKRRYG
jgi:hypothetical protein